MKKAEIEERQRLEEKQGEIKKKLTAIINVNSIP